MFLSFPHSAQMLWGEASALRRGGWMQRQKERWTDGSRSSRAAPLVLTAYKEGRAGSRVHVRTTAPLNLLDLSLLIYKMGLIPPAS